MRRFYIMLLVTLVLSCSKTEYKIESNKKEDLMTKRIKVSQLIGNMGMNHNDTSKYKEAIILLDEILEQDSCNEFDLQSMFFSLIHLKKFKELSCFLASLPSCHNEIAVEILDSYVLLEMHDSTRAFEKLDRIIVETKNEYEKDKSIKAYLEFYLISLKVRGHEEIWRETLSNMLKEGEVDSNSALRIKTNLNYPNTGALLLYFVEMIKFPNKEI